MNNPRRPIFSEISYMHCMYIFQLLCKTIINFCIKFYKKKKQKKGNKINYRFEK